MNDRLQRLREALRMEWGELAQHLCMSRSMLDFARKGQRKLSFKAIRRLEEVEREAGLSSGRNQEKDETDKKDENFAGKGLSIDEIAELRKMVSEWKTVAKRAETLLKKL